MSSVHLKAPRCDRFEVQYMSGFGYVVVDDTGKKCGGPTLFRPQMQRLCDDLQRAADKAAKRGPRPCIRCATEFHSEGIHNRMCLRCRGIGEGAHSVRPAISARKFG